MWQQRQLPPNSVETGHQKCLYELALPQSELAFPAFTSIMDENYYKTLALNRNATAADIKTA